jgi:hypothetical protein
MPGGEPLSQTVGNEIPNGSHGMSLKGAGSESLRALSLGSFERPLVYRLPS